MRPPRLPCSAVALVALVALTVAHSALGEASGAAGWSATSARTNKRFLSSVSPPAPCRLALQRSPRCEPWQRSRPPIVSRAGFPHFCPRHGALALPPACAPSRRTSLRPLPLCSVRISSAFHVTRRRVDAPCAWMACSWTQTASAPRWALWWRRSSSPRPPLLPRWPQTVPLLPSSAVQSHRVQDVLRVRHQVHHV